MSNRPELNYHGNEWGQLKHWLEEELVVTYKRLAGLSCTAEETQQLRGRASLLAQMLGFDETPSAIGRG